MRAITATDIKTSAWLRSTRQASGMTIRAMAKASGLDPSRISHIENELSWVTIESIVKLCIGFGVSQSEFMDSLGFWQGGDFSPSKPPCSSVIAAGRYLRQVRRGRKLTLVNMELMLDMARPTLGNIEKGKSKRITFDLLLRWAQILDDEKILVMFWEAYTSKLLEDADYKFRVVLTTESRRKLHQLAAQADMSVNQYIQALIEREARLRLAAY